MSVCIGSIADIRLAWKSVDGTELKLPEGFAAAGRPAKLQGVTREVLLLLLAAVTPALGGCAVQAAIAAAEIAPQLRGPLGPSNAHLELHAVQVCQERAAHPGSVYIVDVEQRRSDRFIVWGSVTNPERRRRTFECHFTTRLVRFKLGQILPPD